MTPRYPLDASLPPHPSPTAPFVSLLLVPDRGNDRYFGVPGESPVMVVLWCVVAWVLPPWPVTLDCGLLGTRSFPGMVPFDADVVIVPPHTCAWV